MARRGAVANEERAVAEVTRLAHAGLAADELLRRVAKAVERAVPFEAWCGSTVDPASRLLTLGLAEGFGAETIGGEPTGDIFLGRVYFDEDLPQIAAMVGERRSVAVLSEATGGELERSVRYRDLLRPLGFGHEVGVLFLDGSLWGGIDLIREAGRRDFAADEAALLRRIAPRVGAGLRVAALRGSAAAAGDGEDAPGVVTLDAAGRPTTVTPGAERLLGELADFRADWRQGGLPVAVRMVVNALAAALAPGSAADQERVPRLRVRGRSGRWLTLTASRGEGTEGRSSETVVVIGPAGPHEIAWLNVAAYGLSAREGEVVGQVLGGASTRQIAANLFIAEHTVQRHLANVFEKVGVRSRRELLRRLYFEQLLPSLGTNKSTTS